MQLRVNEIDEQRIGEEDGGRVVGVVRVEVRAAGKGIGSGEETAWDMDDPEIEICEVEQPSCLVTVEVLGLTEVCQVLVICKDLDRKRGTMEVMPPGLQGVDDGEEFPVIDVVVLLCGDK